ncbi:hypothetical protein [Fulvivirga sediminis]|uniref:Uncharacterized protein n=1 Tax=Fulvivirga sediminis TaxID=2803949 RepID=A0A937JZE9_9BACT|nr:hypothetical protein [Fulvivirga sediminis]MBL3655121.1 hypothetical protein [Fulvivirga sediminis]
MKKRTRLEREIISCLAERVKNINYELYKEDYSGNLGHKIEFVKKVAEVQVYMILRFVKPNYLRLQTQLVVHSEKVNRELDGYVEAYDEHGVPLINFDIEDYYEEEEGEDANYFFIDKGKIEVEALVNRMYERYFMKAETDFIPNMSGLEKLDQFINDERNWEGDNLVLSPFCFPIQFQIIAGTVCAVLSGNNKSDLIVNRYLEYSRKEFRVNEDSLIDGYWRYLEDKMPEVSM